MTETFGIIVYLLLGYLVGMWLAAPGLFSATVSLTAWGNLWVYTWLLFWPFILAWHFIIWALMTGAGLIVLFLILDKLNLI